MALLPLLVLPASATTPPPVVLQASPDLVGQPLLQGVPGAEGCDFPEFELSYEVAGETVSVGLDANERCELVLASYRQVEDALPVEPAVLAEGDVLGSAAAEAKHASIVAQSYAEGDESLLSDPPSAERSMVPDAIIILDPEGGAGHHPCRKWRTARALVETSRTRVEVEGTYRYQCHSQPVRVERSGACIVHGRYERDSCAFFPPYAWTTAVQEGVKGAFHKEGNIRYHQLEASYLVRNTGSVSCAFDLGGNLPNGGWTTSCGT